MGSTQTQTERDFHSEWITTSEILNYLGISRTSLFAARKTGKLPDGINLDGKTFVWRRKAVTPYLRAWKTVLDARRGAPA